MSSGRVKVCVVCHEDCSGRPRTKDSRGNYYCTPCYEARLEAVRSGQAQSLVPPVIEPASAAIDDDLFGPDPGMIEQAYAFAPPVDASQACPTCGMGVQAGAVICMNCGCNLRTGGTVRTKVVAAPRDRQPIWHIIVGVITIVFCGFIIVLQLPNLLGDGPAGLEMLQSNPNATSSGGHTIGVLISLALATWGLLAGAGITFKQGVAVGWLRAWAIANIVVMCIAVTCIGIGLGALSSGNTPLDSRSIGFLVGVIVVAILLSLSWPIFVLFWFNWSKVQDDVAAW